VEGVRKQTLGTPDGCLSVEKRGSVQRASRRREGFSFIADKKGWVRLRRGGKKGIGSVCERMDHDYSGGWGRGTRNRVIKERTCGGEGSQKHRTCAEGWEFFLWDWIVSQKEWKNRFADKRKKQKTEEEEREILRRKTGGVQYVEPNRVKENAQRVR